jgi:hypothetical protein
VLKRGVTLAAGGNGLVTSSTFCLAQKAVLSGLTYAQIFLCGATMQAAVTMVSRN